MYELRTYVAEEEFVGTGGRKVVHLTLLNPSIEEIESIKIKIDYRYASAYNIKCENQKVSFCIRHDMSPSIAEKCMIICRVKIYYKVKIKIK